MTKSNNTLKVTIMTLALVFAAFVSIGVAGQRGGMMNQGNNGSMMSQQGSTNCPRYQENSGNQGDSNFQRCRDNFGNRANMMNQGSSNQNNMMNQGNGVDVNTGR